MALSDARLRNLKPRSNRYEIADTHGLFVEVMPSGIVSFRYRYWFGRRKEKVTIGTYPQTTLKDARRVHDDYRQKVAAGKSPAREKQIARRSRLDAESFKEFAEFWIKPTAMARAGAKARGTGWTWTCIQPSVNEN